MAQRTKQIAIEDVSTQAAYISKIVFKPEIGKCSEGILRFRMGLPHLGSKSSEQNPPDLYLIDFHIRDLFMGCVLKKPDPLYGKLNNRHQLLILEDEETGREDYIKLDDLLDLLNTYVRDRDEEDEEDDYSDCLKAPDATFVKKMIDKEKFKKLVYKRSTGRFYSGADIITEDVSLSSFLQDMQSMRLTVCENGVYSFHLRSKEGILSSFFSFKVAEDVFYEPTCGAFVEGLVPIAGYNSDGWTYISGNILNKVKANGQYNITVEDVKHFLFFPFLKDEIKTTRVNVYNPNLPRLAWDRVFESYKDARAYDMDLSEDPFASGGEENSSTDSEEEEQDDEQDREAEEAEEEEDGGAEEEEDGEAEEEDGEAEEVDGEAEEVDGEAEEEEDGEAEEEEDGEAEEEDDEAEEEDGEAEEEEEKEPVGEEEDEEEEPVGEDAASNGSEVEEESSHSEVEEHEEESLGSEAEELRSEDEDAALPELDEDIMNQFRCMQWYRWIKTEKTWEVGCGEFKQRGGRFAKVLETILSEEKKKVFKKSGSKVWSDNFPKVAFSFDIINDIKKKEDGCYEARTYTGNIRVKNFVVERETTFHIPYEWVVKELTPRFVRSLKLNTWTRIPGGSQVCRGRS